MNSVLTRAGQLRITTNGKLYRVEQGQDYKNSLKEKNIVWQPISEEMSLKMAKKWIEKKQEIWTEIKLT